MFIPFSFLPFYAPEGLTLNWFLPLTVCILNHSFGSTRKVRNVHDRRRDRGNAEEKKQFTGWVQVCRAGLRREWRWCPSALCYRYPAGSDFHTSPLGKFHHSAGSAASATDLWNTILIKSRYQITLKVLSVILTEDCWSLLNNLFCCIECSGV